ncbi:MAG: MOSC domain-containing protein [Isosphaeraceae bacterium]
MLEQTVRIVSVNVGTPRDVVWQGRTVRTGIFKEPVAGPVPLRRHNLDGDAQADLTVHGGPDKAVYAYPSEHYPAWRTRLNRELSHGIFGENLTTEGLIEDAVYIGDVFRVGTARLVVTQPRMPCFKLGLRFGDPAMVKTFLHVGHPGIYLAVREEGVVSPGDRIERVAEDESRIAVTDMLRLILDHDPDPDDVRRLLEVPALAAVWRAEFESRLAL